MKNDQNNETSGDANGSQELSEKDWDLLLDRIEGGKCVPFLGVKACSGIAQKRFDIASDWESRFDEHLFDIDLEHGIHLDVSELTDSLRNEFLKSGCVLSGSAQATVNRSGATWEIEDEGAVYIICKQNKLLKVSTPTYPFKRNGNLVRVLPSTVQLSLVTGSFPRTKLLQNSSTACVPDYHDLGEPYRIISDLPFPVYITTNYNDYLYQVLKQKPDAEPRLMICGWKDEVKRRWPIRKPDFKNVNPANPVVFHVCGHVNDSSSIVLTEDDYLQLLANLKPLKCLPPKIEGAISRSTLLFLGYTSFNWDLRVLLRIVSQFKTRAPGRRHIAVLQMEPTDEVAAPGEERRFQRYFEQYFETAFQIHVYWGSCQDFAAELWDRWQRREQS